LGLSGALSQARLRRRPSAWRLSTARCRDCHIRQYAKACLEQETRSVSISLLLNHASALNTRYRAWEVAYVGKVSASRALETDQLTNLITPDGASPCDPSSGGAEGARPRKVPYWLALCSGPRRGGYCDSERKYQSELGPLALFRNSQCNSPGCLVLDPSSTGNLKPSRNGVRNLDRGNRDELGRYLAVPIGLLKILGMT
jgi:hypothetical protein